MHKLKTKYEAVQPYTRSKLISKLDSFEHAAVNASTTTQI
jgi:hypothetical protein